MNRLVSLNIGVRLTVQDEQGKEREMEMSMLCPSKEVSQPSEAIQKLCDLINQTFETDMFIEVNNNDTVSIAKPSKIKAPRIISHKTFNQRVKKNLEQLGYKE